MEEGIANLRLIDEEEEEFNEESTMVERSYQFCLVGRCLTDSVVHFLSLRNTMTDLWHPIGGICISDLGEKRYLFQFFHEVDLQRVISGTPWFFNNHLLILQIVRNGEDPLSILLNFTEFWVQIHDLPYGLMSESMAKQFGEFLGQFIEYDYTIPSTGFRKYIHVRVRLDVSMPLKRKKKVRVSKEMTVYACFQAVARRRTNMVSRWLREADGSACCNTEMERNNQFSNFSGERNSGRNLRADIGTRSILPNLMLEESGQKQNVKDSDNWHILDKEGSAINVGDNGPMDMMFNEEDDPLFVLEGKKVKGWWKIEVWFFKWIDVRASGTKGGLSLGWKGNSVVQLKSFSSWHIDVEIHGNDSSISWRLMGFYGNPKERSRGDSWKLLQQLGNDQSTPWVVMGDFNEIMSSFEKNGGRLKSERQIEEF
ncbi:hypothetical protein CXB51_013877 [Gossypium anomalum]|uniref:DUF4283 domain-containing protein n=1 Tax=Gossypium anomalum TaxID=47600 RepID=A0A8J5ZKK1_9ROSI|nr:hypothetical protein CXB51_013877 [Gossypium anomalum]